jgi:hypothetical protein
MPDDSYLDNPDSWRLATPIKGVPYRFVSAEAEYTYNEGEAVWSVIIPQDRISDFRDEMFPPPDPGKVEQGFVELPRPKVMPGDPSMVATKIKITPHVEGKPFDLFSHDANAAFETYQPLAAVEITFSTKEDIEYLEIRGEGSGEFITIPPTEKAVYDLVSAGVTQAEIDANPDWYTDYVISKKPTAITIMLPLINWSVTWTGVPFEFFTETLVHRLRDAMGKINHAPLEFLFGAPMDTILFLNWDYAQTNTYRLYEGKRAKTVNVTMNFVEKRIPLQISDDETGDSAYGGHNHHYVPGVGWAHVAIGDDPKPTYKQTDLAILIQSVPIQIGE